MPAPIIIGAIISAAVAGIGMAIEAGQRGEAQRIRKEVADKYGAEAVAQLDRALIDKIPSSELAGVVEDRSLRESQVNALREFEKSYQQEGMTESDIAALRLVQNEAASAAASQNAGAQANMARRGLANSGLAAAMSMQAGQNAANAVGRAGMQAHADARLRALRSLEASANIGRGIRGDDWRAMSAKASAQDELNRYNNEAAFRTTAYNNSMAQQDYDNRMRRLTATGNAELGHAAGTDAAATRTAQGFGGVAQGVLSTSQYIDEGEREKAKNGGWK